MAQQRKLVHAQTGTQLGLPELTLGILPGFGGTQRLPRLVGLQKGVEMILTSKPIKSEAGLKAGLVDAVLEEGKLLATAKQWAVEMAEGVRHRPFTLYRCDRCEVCNWVQSPAELFFAAVMMDHWGWVVQRHLAKCHRPDQGLLIVPQSKHTLYQA